MKLIVRDPDKGYLSDNLWVPKAHCQVEGVKSSLTFQFNEKSKVRVLTLWRETPTHLVVPREFWDPETFNFPIVDCRPLAYPQVDITSNIRLDHRVEGGKYVSTGETTQQDAMQALLLSRGGILQLACVAGDTVLNLNRAGKGFEMTIAEAHRRFHGDPTTPGPKWRHDIPTFTRAKKNNKIGLHKVEDIVHRGFRETFELHLRNGQTLRLTKDHKVLTPDGFRTIFDEGFKAVIVDGGQKKWGTKAVSERKKKPVYKRLNWYPSHPFAHKNGKKGEEQEWVLEEHRAIAEARLNRLTLEKFRERCRAGIVEELVFIDPKRFHVHHIDENPKNNAPENLEVLAVEVHRAQHQPGSDAFGYGRPEVVEVNAVLAYGMEAVYDVVCADPHHNFVANGIVVHNCGKGKTVVALDLVARRKVPAIVIVDTTQLYEQWKTAAEMFLKIPGGVGFIGAGEFDWKKAFVIATYHSLSAKADTFPEEARRWFGTIIWDEAHHVAAPTFAKTADLFFGMRLGLTATPDRDDGMHVVYNHHIGRVLYKNLAQELKPRIYFKWTGLSLDPQCMQTQMSTKDKNGELHIGKVASFFGQWRQRLDVVLTEVRMAVAEDRKIIVLSNSVDELINLLAIWNGQPLYTDLPFPDAAAVEETIIPGYMGDIKYVEKMMKDIAITRAQLRDPNILPIKQKNLEEKVKLVHFRLEQHRVWKKCMSLYKKQQKEYLEKLLEVPSTAGLMIYKVKASERTRMLGEKQVTFAVSKYGREGLDEPTLDTIIVCEPLSSRNSLQQLMGRIQRRKPGKKAPVVVFLEDDIGPMIGMCVKLRKHLKTWPQEESGPYTYEMIGHPSSMNRRKTWATPSVTGSGL